LLGWLTLIRMAYRNINTDEYKEGIRRIKEYYLTKYKDLDQYLSFHTKNKPTSREKKEFRGGYIEVIKLINSVLLTLILYMFFSFIFYKVNNVLSFKCVLAALLISLSYGIIFWFIQHQRANLIYKKNKAMKVNKKNIMNYE
jgi:hypothetical protein